MKKEEIILMANRVDTVFYCLYTKNKQLKEDVEIEIVTECAKQMNAEHFSTRSGPEVQDPKTLFEELSWYDDIQKYNIIVINVDTSDFTRLSMSDKRKLFEMLKSYQGTENSGEIADKILED